MNCLEFQGWLQEKLDGGTDPCPPALAQHHAQCSDCRELEEASRRLTSGLALMAKPAPAPLLTQSILSGVHADRRQRLTIARRRAGVTAALAAAILLFMVTYWLYQPRSPIKNDFVKGNGPVAPVQPQTPELMRSADDARQAVASLSERVADQTKEQAKLLMAVANSIELPPMASLPALSDLGEPLDPAAQSLRHATETVASGIEPITRSTRRAFTFFAKEMPMFDLPAGN